ncbi:MAG TPA: PH domain-containing protein [Lacipirellulaceae bacterium]|jgi:hypothetical protein|nr:PH domain-containing protein [Lacipirellulaceae bacterium]
MFQTPEESIRRELDPSEQLLWFGQPAQGFILRSSDAFLVPFSIIWGGFAIFWEVSVVSEGAPLDFAIFGVPFVLMGLYIMFGRFWVDARQRANTTFGVTPERIIIISGLFSRHVKSINLDTLSDLSITEKANGVGTISFGNIPFWAWIYGGAAWPGLGFQAVPQFELIPNARSTYEIVRAAQRATKRSA